MRAFRQRRGYIRRPRLTQWRLNHQPATVAPDGSEVLNLVVVIGTLGRAPQVRALPSGFSLASFDVQVARSDDAFDIVPVAFFDPPQEVCSLPSGAVVLVVGRVRRRFFRVGGSTQSRTEVVAEKLVAITDPDELRSALNEPARLLAQLAEGEPGAPYFV